MSRTLLGFLNGSLSGRAVLYLLGDFSIKLLSVVASPIFVRLMTAEEYGLAAVFMTWVSLLSNFLGLRVDGTVLNAQSRYGSNALTQYCSSTIILSASSLIIFILVTPLFPGLVKMSGLSVEMWSCAGITAFFLACSNVRMEFFKARKQADKNMLVSFLLSFSQVAISVSLLLLIHENGYVERVAGYVIPTVLIGIVISLYFIKLGHTFYKKEYWSFCLKLSLPLIFNGAAYLIINQSGRLIVNSLLGPGETGVYSFATSIGMMASVVTTSLGNAWTPEFYSNMDGGETETLLKRSDRYAKNMAIIFCLALLASPEVLKMLGTPEYYSGLSMLPFTVLTYFLQYLYTWPVNYKFYHSQTKDIALATLLAALINVAACFVLTDLLGIVGTSIASLLAFSSLLLMHHLSAKRSIDAYPFNWDWYLKLLSPVLVISVFTFVFLDVALLRWAVASIFFVLLVHRVWKTRSFF